MVTFFEVPDLGILLDSWKQMNLSISCCAVKRNSTNANRFMCNSTHNLHQMVWLVYNELELPIILPKFIWILLKENLFIITNLSMMYNWYFQHHCSQIYLWVTQCNQDRLWYQWHLSYMSYDKYILKKNVLSFYVQYLRND